MCGQSFSAVATEFSFTLREFVGLTTDRVAVLLHEGGDITLRVQVEYPVGVVSTDWHQRVFKVSEVLGVLGVPGVVAVLLVTGAPLAMRHHLPVLPVDIAGHRGPEGRVAAERGGGGGELSGGVGGAGSALIRPVVSRRYRNIYRMWTVDVIGIFIGSGQWTL